MPNTPINTTNITPPRVPLIDARTGLISREWYRFFLNLFTLVGSGDNATSLTDVQLGPPNIPVEALQIDPNALVNAPSDSALVSETAELQKALQALQEIPAEFVSELPVIWAQLQALAVAPPNTPQRLHTAYGAFYDTTNQTAAANTPTAITYNTTQISAGVYLGSPTSRVQIDSTSLYNIQFSVQFSNSSATTDDALIWLRVNGTDEPNTNSWTAVPTKHGTTNGQIITALNLFRNFVAGDYFELIWMTVNGTTSLETLPASTAAPVYPASPSIILTVADNIAPIQL